MEPLKAIKYLAGLFVVVVLIGSSLACDEEQCGRYGCVRMYEHRNHEGRHRCHYPGRDRCSNFDVEDEWGVSSMRFHAGGCVRLHSDRDCGGRSLRMDSNHQHHRDFSGTDFEDRVRSIGRC